MYCTIVCSHRKMHHVIRTHTIVDQATVYARARNNLTLHTHNVHASAPRPRSYNYIFKVLFTAPSWYVFSIGFGHMSIFR